MEVRPIDANALKRYFSDRQMEYVSVDEVDYTFNALTRSGIRQVIRHESGRSLCCLRLRQRGVIKMEKCCKEPRRQRTF